MKTSAQCRYHSLEDSAAVARDASLVRSTNVFADRFLQTPTPVVHKQCSAFFSGLAEGHDFQLELTAPKIRCLPPHVIQH